MEQTKSKTPIGMKLICLLYILSVLGYVLSSMKKLPIQITSFQRILGIVIVIIWILIIISILKRFKWGWYLVLLNNAYDLVKSIVSYFFPHPGIPYSSIFSPIFSLLGIIIAVAIAIYIFRNKSYFNV